MEAWMEVVVGRHVGQSQSGNAEALPVCEVKTLMTPDCTAVQVPSSGLGLAGIGRSS